MWDLDRGRGVGVGVGVGVGYVGSPSSLCPISITTKSPLTTVERRVDQRPSLMKERVLRPFLAWFETEMER